MEEAVRTRLRQLNRTFYDEHSQSFSSTRGAAWAGWSEAVDRPPASVLDLGCGNGRFLRYLQSLDRSSELERYVGTDTSLSLLHAAHRMTQTDGAHFVLHDLEHGLASTFAEPFDLVVAFGVLHHVPGEAQRAEFLRNAAQALSPAGSLLVTCWQFGTEPRFASRCDEWQTLGLEESDVEPGDHLLRWGDSGMPSAVRYCHHTTPKELERLAESAQLSLRRSFLADGKGGRLNLYAELQRASPDR